jgi:prefoldin subunit 5
MSLSTQRTNPYNLRIQDRPSYDETKRRKRSRGVDDGSILPGDSASNIASDVSQTVMNVFASTVGTPLNTANYQQDIAGLVNTLTDTLNDRYHPAGVHVKCSDFDQFKEGIGEIINRLYQAAVTEIAMKETEVNTLRRDAIALKEQYEEELESLQTEKAGLSETIQDLRPRLQQIEGMHSVDQQEIHTLRGTIADSECNARRLCAKIEKLRASNNVLQQQLDMYCVDADYVHFPTIQRNGM